MKPDQKAAIEKRTVELTAAIRHALVEPAEGVIATLERIGERLYEPEVARYVLEQLGELKRELQWKLSGDASTIRRLGNGLYNFEKRLFAMRGRE